MGSVTGFGWLFCQSYWSLLSSVIMECYCELWLLKSIGYRELCDIFHNGLQWFVIRLLSHLLAPMELFTPVEITCPLARWENHV